MSMAANVMVVRELVGGELLIVMDMSHWHVCASAEDAAVLLPPGKCSISTLSRMVRMPPKKTSKDLPLPYCHRILMTHRR